MKDEEMKPQRKDMGSHFHLFESKVFPSLNEFQFHRQMKTPSQDFIEMTHKGSQISAKAEHSRNHVSNSQEHHSGTVAYCNSTIPRKTRDTRTTQMVREIIGDTTHDTNQDLRIKLQNLISYYHASCNNGFGLIRKAILSTF